MKLFNVPANLHPDTANLVGRFAEALAFKLTAAQEKHGYTNNWMRPDWMNICRTHLLQHLEKGDPRDVAAYCAFLWHHGESTAWPITEVGANADLAAFAETIGDFEACGETATPYDTLMRWTTMGWLECIRFDITPEGRAALAAAPETEGNR